MSSGMRRNVKHSNQQANTGPPSYGVDDGMSGGYAYPNTGYYDMRQNSGGAQLFDDMSQIPVSGAAADGGAAAYGYGNQYQSYPPNPSMNFYDPNSQIFNAINQQMLGTGSHILQNQMAAAANFYTGEIKKNTWTWIGSLKYYFAVDTGYVLKKLMLLFFPFTQKSWSVHYNPEGPISPKDDINAPDLYIPIMSFVTYVLLAGYLLGLNNQFSPEKLGIQASAAMAWLLMEVLIVLTVSYLLGISSALGFFHLLAFSSYKFVCMNVCLLIGLVSQLGYYGILAYSSFSLAYFLIRTLHLAIESNPSRQTASTGNRNSIYLLVIICLFQPLVMYWLTRHFIVSNENLN